VKDFNGRPRRNLAACATDCVEGMEVLTHSARVINARRTVVELILSDHPTDCLTCAKSGNCELQSLAQYLGIRDIPFKGEQSHYRQDTVNPASCVTWTSASCAAAARTCVTTSRPSVP
jgi:Uncharacterized anaerobic dehydrogenase